MENRLMKTLTFGTEGFEVKDGQAREDILKLKENSVKIHLEESKLIQKKLRSYTYDNMVEDIEKLREEFSGNTLFRIKELGTSEQGHQIYALEYGSETAKKHLFVFNGFHAKDTSSSIALAQMETLIRNDYYKDVDIKNDILAVDTCVHVIPMTNPDGYMLGHAEGGFNYFANKGMPVSSQTQANIKNWIEDYIKNHLKDDINGITDSNGNYTKMPIEPGSSWDVETLDDLHEYIRECGGNPNESYSKYQFREKDLRIWSANINGIDLHYNWYTDDMRTKYDSSYVSTAKEHTDGYVYGACGSEAYADENFIYKNYIDSFNPNSQDTGVHMAFLNYHQKGPTLMWNYRLNEVGDVDVGGLLQNRSYDCGKSLAALTHMTYSKTIGTQSVPMGFTAWATRYIPEAYTLAYTMEIGWKTSNIRGDGYSDTTNPNAVIVCSTVPDEQWEDIYNSQKEVFLHMVRYYVSLRDISNNHQDLNEYNFAYKITDKTRFGVPSMQMMREYGYYKSIDDLGVFADIENIDNVADPLYVLVNKSFVSDSIHNFTYFKELRCSIASSHAIAQKFPSWFKVKYGSLHVYLCGGSQVVVDFYPQDNNLCYRKMFRRYKNGDEYFLVQTNWTNLTHTVTDYTVFGINPDSSSLNYMCSLIPSNHKLELILSTDKWTKLNLPSEIKQKILHCTLDGSDSIVHVTLVDPATFVTYMTYHTRKNEANGITTGSLGEWKVITPTNLK